MIKIIGCYIVVINIISFLIYGADKRRARLNRWRISEVTLLGLAVIGGSAGALLGMYTFHHKTRKMKFVIMVPLILVVQLILVYFIVCR